MLTESYFGMVKRPETALIKANQTWPSVVVYVETNETETEVLDNVKQWLYGTNGDVKLVIVIATHEENLPPSKAPGLADLIVDHGVILISSRKGFTKWKARKKDQA